MSSSDPFREFPPGVSGQVWDRAEDGPVHFGRVELRLGDEPVAETAVGPGGTFAIESALGEHLAPDVYELIVEVAGYRTARRRVEVSSDMPSCRVGRIELEPA